MNVNEEKNLKGYLLIWVGQLISLAGSGIVQFAIIWWITNITGSTFILALASFAGLIPLVIFTPLSGVLTDRWSRKYIILITDFLQALLTVGLIVLFYLKFAGILAIISILFLRGVFQALQLPATIALVPQMVPKNQISRMNGLNSIFNNIIYAITPITGALLLEVSSLEFILSIDLFTFLFAVLTLSVTSVPSIMKNDSNLNSSPVKKSFKKEFIEGLSYLKANGFMPLILGGMFVNILVNPLFTLLPFYIKNLHNGGALELALVMGFFQMGNLVGALVIIVKNFIPKLLDISFAVFIAFSGLFLLGIAPSGSFPIIVFGSLITGISLGTVDIMIVSLLQTYVPSQLQGRVFSIFFTLIKSILPIAVLITGSITEIIGLSIIYIINPILGFILVAYIAFKSKSSDFDQNLIMSTSITPNITPQTG